MEVAVSVLKRRDSLEDAIDKINVSSAKYLHIDVMDGTMTKATSEDYDADTLKKSVLPIQLHLMSKKPLLLIEKYRDVPLDTIVVHAEIEGVCEVISAIKTRGYKCGLAINPYTELEVLLKYIDIVDTVLVMTVIPGEGGQKMINSTLYKIDALRMKRDEGRLNFKIVVDGGVNEDTVCLVKNADIVVSGSYIAMHSNYEGQIKKLLE